MRYILLSLLLVTAAEAAPKVKAKNGVVPFKIERSKANYTNSAYVRANQGLSNTHPVGGVARQYTNRPKYN